MAIIILSLILNLWSINAGLPERWGEDEITGRAMAMARNLTVIPAGFYYGTLHYFQIIAVTVPTYALSLLLSLDIATQATLVHLAARSLSAVFGVACVALTFLIARQLFDRRTGLLAALLLASTMGLVSRAHYARVDVPMTFWMLASLLMSARALTVGTRSSYVLAGVFAGLAAGVKYVGGFALLNLVVAYLLRGATRDHRGLLYGILASAASFVLVNPAIWVASCAFVEGFVVDNAFNGGLGQDREGALAQLTLVVSDAVGGALAIVIPIALAYCVLLSFQRKNCTQVLFLTAMIPPFLLLLSRSNRSVIDYVVPILPLLAIATGKLLADLITAPTRPARWGGVAIVISTIGYSALFTIESNLRLTYDPRRLAGEWIERNLPPGSKVETTSYGPSNLKDRFVVVMRPHDHFTSDRVARMEQDATYHSLMRWVRAYQSFAEHVGLCDGVRPYYEPWFAASRRRLVEQRADFDTSIEGLHARAPDVLVVSSRYYDRFKHDSTSPDGRFFARLFAGDSTYRPVAEFRSGVLPWFDYSTDALHVKIYARAGSRPRGIGGQPDRLFSPSTVWVP